MRRVLVLAAAARVPSRGHLLAALVPLTASSSPPPCLSFSPEKRPRFQCSSESSHSPRTWNLSLGGALHTLTASTRFSPPALHSWRPCGSAAYLSQSAQADDDQSTVHPQGNGNPEKGSGDGQTGGQQLNAASSPPSVTFGQVGGMRDYVAAGAPDVERLGSSYPAYEPQPQVWGRPSASLELQKVAWNAALQNNISLIGILGWVGECSTTMNGNLKCRCRLAVIPPRWLRRRAEGQDTHPSPAYDQGTEHLQQQQQQQHSDTNNSASSDQDWYTVMLFGELADAAARGLLYRGQRVVVQGTVHLDPYFKDGERIMDVTVTARTVAEVLPADSAYVSPYDSLQGLHRPAHGGSWESNMLQGPGSHANLGGGFPQGGPMVRRRKEDVWREFVEFPQNFIDCRLSKTNPRGPDFVHVKTKDGLWVDSMPAWVPPHLCPPPGP